MLRAELRYLKATVRLVDHFLVYALHLIAEDDGVAARGVYMQVLQLCRAFHLLDGVDEHALFVESVDGLGGCLEVAPCHGVLAAEGCLVDFGVGWGGGDAA